MPAVLWVLAVGSYWTFAHRMYHTWREVWRADTATMQAAQASKAADAGKGAKPDEAGGERRGGRKVVSGPSPTS